MTTTSAPDRPDRWAARLLMTLAVVVTMSLAVTANESGAAATPADESRDEQGGIVIGPESDHTWPPRPVFLRRSPYDYGDTRWEDWEDWDNDDDSDDDEAGVHWDATFGFQRVDGIQFGLSQRIRGEGELAPRLLLHQARAFHRGRWLFGVEFSKPLLRGGPTVGGGFFRRTALFADLDGERIDDVENSLAVLIIKKDFRDYFEEEGLRVFVRQPIGTAATVEAQVVRAEHRPLENSIRTSLIRWDDDFRPNPTATEGTYRAFLASASLDTRHRRGNPVSAQWFRASIERAGGTFGGDFDFTRLLVDMRQYWRTTPGQQLNVRTILGRRLDGDLPTQKRFAIGGVGTLRAHDFKELVGDAVFLANAEYTFDFLADTFAMVFLDTGATANSAGELEDSRFALDGGIGFGLSDERAAIYVARDLRETSADLQVSLRLTSMF